MGTLICFKCRQPLDKEAGGLCVHCDEGGSTPSDPGSLGTERSFLLARGLELSDMERPAFLGYSEEELEWKAHRVPSLPLGEPRVEIASEEPTEKLLKKLSAGESRERGLAAIKLGRELNHEVILFLLKRLVDPEPEVRGCILWALGQEPNTLILGPLLEYMEVEKDVVVRAQAAATLYQIASHAPALKGKRDDKGLEEKLRRVETELAERPATELYLKRGRLRLRGGSLLKALGDFSRSVDDEGDPQPESLMYRSQAFFLMGKPLFALDDLIECPRDHKYPAIFYLHKVTLVTMAKQIAANARKRGLEEYALLFERRLESLKDK